MEIQDSKVLSVTREYELGTEIGYFTVYRSGEFEIVLDKLQTTWRLMCYKDNGKLSICLRKIKSSSNDFVVSILIKLPKDKKIEKQYDGSLLASEDWFFLGKVTSNINIQITLSEKLVSPQYDHAKESLFMSASFNDFKFVCSDGETVLANRSLISTHSDVMKTMLEAPMLESKNKMAKLDDIDSLTMQEVMRFMLTGRVNDIEIHVNELFYCAEKYGISSLREFCVTAMKRDMNSKNVIDYLLLARNYKVYDLYKLCLSFVEFSNEIIAEKDLERLKRFDPLLYATLTYLLDREVQIKPLKLEMKVCSSSAPPYC